MAEREVVVLRVPREKVVRAARLAIERARRRGHEVDEDLSARLMSVAREHREFALGTWRVDGRCGCLVGNLLRYHEGDAPNPGSVLRDGPLYSVGVHFDWVLRDSLTRGQRARIARTHQYMGAQHVARVTG